MNELVKDQPQPRINECGDLVIPTNAPARYRWWRGGQSVWATLAELDAPLSVWQQHAANRPDLLTDGHAVRCAGEIGQGRGFVYCVGCGSYVETQQSASVDASTPSLKG